MRRTFIQHILSVLFNRKKEAWAKAEENLKTECKKQPRPEAKAKEAQTEKKARSSIEEIKNLIDLINNSSSNDSKPNRGRKRANVNDTVDSKTGNHDSTGGDHGGKKGASPAEVLALVAKAEKKLSKAAAKAKAKEKDDKKARGGK